MKPSQFNVYLELADGQHAIYHTASGQVDQICAWFHQGQLLSTDQITGEIIQRHVEADEIGS